MSTTPAKVESLEAYEVPPEEWQELFGEHEPFKTHGFPNPDSNKAVALRDPVSGKLRAYWWICTAVHFEPLWICPEDRRNPGVMRRLWRTVLATAKRYGVVTGFALVAHDNPDADTIHTAALKAGFRRAAADLYFAVLDEVKEF